MIPPNSNAKVVLLIGLPNWPNRRVYQCTLQKVKLETKNTHWFMKTFFHIIYALRLLTTFRTWRAFQRKHVNVGKAAIVVLVRNELDTYMADGVSQQLANDRKWNYIKVPGQHDDLWDNPQPYLDIITQETKSISI